MVEADKNARLLTTVLIGDVVVVRAVDDTANSGVFKIAQAGELVGHTVGHIAPDDAVVVFVVAVFMIHAADAFRGEVHYEVAIVRSELSAGIHAASADGGIVANDAVFERWSGIIVKVYATALGRCNVVADTAVGVVDTIAVANTATH